MRWQRCHFDAHEAEGFDVACVVKAVLFGEKGIGQQLVLRHWKSYTLSTHEDVVAAAVQVVADEVDGRSAAAGCHFGCRCVFLLCSVCREWCECAAGRGDFGHCDGRAVV